MPLRTLAALGLALTLCGVAAATPDARPDTRSDMLKVAQDRGVLRCGVNGQIPGLSLQDDDGDWSGIDADFCRAVAAAALGSADKVEFVPLSAEQRLQALQQGQVDLLSRNTSWTAERDIAHGISFAGILYFDGQGFMVPRQSGLMSTLELGGATVCAVSETTSADNVRRYFTRHRMPMTLALHPDLSTALTAYLNGDCSTLTTDHSQLSALRAGLEEPTAQRILPEVISKEPLGPAVRKGEQRLFDLVRWTLFTLINAEELGIDSGNVVAARERASSEAVRTLLDLDGDTSGPLGIDREWGYRVIRQVGNYGELFERNLGSPSGIGLKRGLNALWTHGGLLYAPPTR
ncbi:amino acid ABC transporter substrate-binding protein [Thiohalocapsa marina]|uniref:Amino acid ABC transporter substrate-binding protein n=2 Tax=Thiohalocapsa marina TaxID=424902 RepID=A0A5M8FCI3_9GAMM|nr:amino acid ABC transporter substrate-binding protein [Thiohalocapsa marina]